MDRGAGVVVVPDRGGEREDGLQDADQDPGLGVSAVSFQVEVAFEGLVDRFDGLAQRFEQACAGPFGLALTGRAQQVDTGGGQVLLEKARRWSAVRGSPVFSNARRPFSEG